MDMDFQSDEPEMFSEGGEEDDMPTVKVFGSDIYDLPPTATPDGVVCIVRTHYDGHARSCLSHRISDEVSPWEAEAMLREALQWLVAARMDVDD